MFEGYQAHRWGRYGLMSWFRVGKHIQCSGITNTSTYPFTDPCAGQIPVQHWWRPTITNFPSTRTSWMRSFQCWLKDLERVMPSLGFRVYWGSALVFQECNLWNPVLMWVHDGFGVDINGEVLALNLYGIKFFTEKTKRYIMYVKGMRVLFVILKRKSRRKSVLTLYAFDSLTGRKVHKTQRSLCLWLGCGFGSDFDRRILKECGTAFGVQGLWIGAVSVDELLGNENLMLSRIQRRQASPYFHGFQNSLGGSRRQPLLQAQVSPMSLEESWNVLY